MNQFILGSCVAQPTPTAALAAEMGKSQDAAEVAIKHQDDLHKLLGDPSKGVYMRAEEPQGGAGSHQPLFS